MNKITITVTIVLIIILAVLFIYSQYSKNKMMVTSINTVVSPGYILFQDPDFPFTFEYPEDWNTVELSTDGRTPNRVFDDKLKDILIGKDVSIKPESRKIGEWFVISKGETPFPSNARPPSTKIMLDGREARMYDVGSGLSVYIIQISVGSNVYEIHFNSKGIPSSKFEKLKSSFRFRSLIRY